MLVRFLSASKLYETELNKLCKSQQTIYIGEIHKATRHFELQVLGEINVSQVSIPKIYMLTLLLH